MQPAMVRDQGRRPAKPISKRRLARMHARARRQHARSLPAQRLVRLALMPGLRLAWRPQIQGRERIPQGGQLLVAANHRSALDPLAVIYALDRPARFMATSDMFTSRLRAMLLLRLGAFPVMRGESDADAIETARLLLEAGETVCVFPEGRLVRPGRQRPEGMADGAGGIGEVVIGDPKRGVGRLAIETGTSILPMAIIGTDAPVAPWWRRGAEIRVLIGEPILPYPSARRQEGGGENAGDGAAAASQLVSGALWPKVKAGVAELEIDRRTALAAGAGVGLTAVALLGVRAYAKARQRRR